MSASLRLASTSVLLLASVALAQIPPLSPPLTFIDLPARGMMSAFSAGIVFSNNPSVIVHKRPGIPARLDSFSGSGNVFVSEYSGESVRAALSMQAGVTVPALQFDAISSGNDLLPLAWVQGSGTFQIVHTAAQAWATLYMSMRGPGIDPADIYGYYSENSSFPAQLRSAIYREAVRADYAAGTVPLPGANHKIVGLDVAMGLLHDNRGEREPNVLDCVDRMYFSLTSVSAAQLQATGAIPGATLDGATIFEAAYDQNTGQVYSVIVHRTGTSLGLPQGADIDALGMGVVNAPALGTTVGVPLVQGSMMYVLSTVRNPVVQREELFVVGTPSLTPVQETTGPLRAHNGQPLVGPGATPPFHDEQVYVEGVCEQDPEVPAGTMSFGVPRPNLLAPQPSPLNLSLTAYWSAVNPPDDRFLLTGVVSGVGQPGPASVFLAVRRVWIDQWELFELLPRQGSSAAYSFEKKLAYPWSGPAMLGTSNEYEVFVATLPTNATTPTFDYTHSSWLRRRYYP